MFKQKLTTSWFNYKTGQYDNLEDAPISYEDYIPQDVAAQGIYRCYINLGLKPTEAAINTLSKCVGEDAPFEPERK